ncbi:hypothetical protein Godav_004326 [Gossypium davidsonii]|uniref:Ribose-5-phosphate isomerase n=1 Tax=Gossypium davidsonii TaxID=34287 RepID=A0A7J8SLM3_GOSDV|nr:hypothetical protein [Gossypium davidsonii]
MMATAAAAANLPCLPQTWKANNPKGRHKVITWERKTKSPSLTACYCSLSETSPLFRAAKHTIDFAFDDVDIIEERTLISVIGCQRLQGEESIIQEKLVLSMADQLVFMVTENQYKRGLEGSIPVVIESLNWLETAEEIDDLFLGDAEVWRRPSIGHADPLGGDFPLVTSEGHNILDLIFTSPIASLAEVAESLEKVDGVVEHGVVSKFPCKAIVASESGLSIVDNIPTNAVGGV